MDNQRPAAERVRPILQAMERSIESARRSRVKPGAPATTAPAPSTSPVTNANSPIARINGEPSSNPPTRFSITAALTGATQAIDGPQRLKARPKRLASPFASPLGQPALRSQVG